MNTKRAKFTCYMLLSILPVALLSLKDAGKEAVTTQWNWFDWGLLALSVGISMATTWRAFIDQTLARETGWTDQKEGSRLTFPKDKPKISVPPLMESADKP